MSSAESNIFEPGLRIVQARGIKNMSQAELGTKLGKTKLTIGRWERGTHPIPDLAWDALSRVLDVRVEWLRDGQGAMSFTPIEKILKTAESAAKEYDRVHQEEILSRESDDEKKKAEAKDELGIAWATMDLIVEASRLKKWLQTQPDRDKLEGLEVYQLMEINTERTKNYTGPDFLKSVLEESSNRPGHGKFEFTLDYSDVLSASRRITLSVLDENLRKLRQSISYMTDEQLAEITSALRDSIAKAFPKP